MPVRVTCPTCEARFEAAATARGAKVKCPNCGDFAKVPRKRNIDSDSSDATANTAKWIIGGIIAAVVVIIAFGIAALIYVLKPSPTPIAAPPAPVPVVPAAPPKRPEPSPGFLWLDNGDYGFSVQMPMGFIQEKLPAYQGVSSIGYIGQHGTTKLNVRVRAYRFTQWKEPDAAAFGRFLTNFEGFTTPGTPKAETLGGLNGFEFQATNATAGAGLKDKVAKLKETSDNIPDPFAPGALEKLEKHLEKQKDALEGIGDLLGGSGLAKKVSSVRVAAGAGKTVYVVRADPDGPEPDPFVWAVVTGSFTLTR